MIPVHKGKNLAGISSEFISDPFGFTCVATSTMSHFYKVTIPGYRIFVISKADLVKHVLITKSNKYGKGRIYWKSLSRITGTGLATSEGPHWLQRRRLMQPFFSKNVICKYITDIGRIAARYYSLKLGTNKEGVVSDMFQIGNETTSEITLYNLLGLGPQEYSSEFYEKVKRSQEYILYCAKYPWNEFLSAFNGKKKLFKQDVRYFDNIIYKHIHDRKNDTGASNNILTELVQCKDEKGIPAYSNKQIRDDYITLLGGGSENSSACFAWTMYLLWKHPEKLNRLRTEVDSLLGLDQTVNENIINHLNYTEMVLKESLRLYPPGYALIREAKEDDIIDGENIPKGSTIYIAVNVLHRHKDYWTNPEEFRPERFELNDEGTSVKFAYIPFGTGQHACIGMHFALAELKVLLATLVRRYNFSLHRKEPIRVLSKMTPHPEYGLSFRFIKRHS